MLHGYETRWTAWSADHLASDKSSRQPLIEKRREKKKVNTKGSVNTPGV